MYQKINCFLSKHQTNIFRILFGGWIIVLLSYCIFKWYNFTPYYEEWQISDWLINYEGGFVRRGLLGDILYRCYQIHPYPIYYVIIILAALSTLLLLWVTIRIFLKEGWSLAILPSFFMFAFSWTNIAWTRRDHWVLLIAIGIFYLYNRYLKERKNFILVLFHALNILVILIHEASFFFIIPIIGIHYFFHEKKVTNKNISITFFRSFLFMFPAIIAMALVCLYKGNIHTATTIWESWYPTMQTYPLTNPNPSIGTGVNALTWNTWETFKMHFHANWETPFYTSIPFIPSFPFTLLNFIGIYYCVTRLNTINFKWNILKSFDKIQMSNILLLQWLFLLPMFTVLSCDYGRTLPYWILSSLFCFHFLKNNWYLPKWITSLSVYCQNFIDKISLLHNPWFYSFVLLGMPISSVGGANITGSFTGQIILGIKKIITFIL